MKQIAVLLGALLLVTAARAELSPVVLNQQPLLQHQRWDYVLDKAGKVWLAYYGDDGFLHVRRPDGSQIQLGATDRPHQLSGLALAATADNLALLWRDKMPTKTLYFLPTIPGGEKAEPLAIGGADSEALTRLELEQRDGVTYFLWLGEKSDPESGQKYHLYFRYSEDGGKTLSPVERVLPGYYPTWIVDKDFIPVFSWASIDGQLVMAMRRFDRQKKAFGPVVKITDAPTISPFFRAFESAGRWFLVWEGHYGDGSELLLEGAYSDDKGQTWKRFAFESLRGLDLSGLDMAADGKGHVLVALSGSWRIRDKNEKAKNDLYFFRSSDNGSTWSPPEQIRTEAARATEAKYPFVTFGATPGSVLMAWEDWRDIRANVYTAYSSDYGATWGEQVPLAADKGKNLGLDFKARSVVTNRGDRYQVVAERYTDDSLKQFNLVLYTFTLDELKRQAAELAKKAEEHARVAETRLRERIAAYYQALINGDYKTTYDLSDPFFRNRREEAGYIKNMGRIKYHSFEIGAVKLQGDIADVEEKFEASVPEFEYNGRKVDKPRQAYTYHAHWLFIDGDWYREYYEESNNVRYTRY